MDLFKRTLEPSYFKKVGSDLIYPRVFDYATPVFLLNPTEWTPATGQITSKAQLDSEKTEFTGDLTVLAANFADSVWTSNGWNLASLDTDIQTFYNSNLIFEESSNEADNPGMNYIVVKKNIDGTNYTVVFLYVGNQNNLNLNSGYAGLAGSSGLNQIISSSEDDTFRELENFPFDFYFFGTNYKDSVFGSSNTYFTFGYGSGQYSGLSASSPGRAIHLGSSDNSWQQVWAGIVSINGNQGYRVLYEGTNSTGGTPGSPNIVIETTFFEGQKINVTLGVHARTNGLIGITDGTSFQPSFSLTPNTSYAIYSDASGYNWVVESGKYFG